MSKEGLVNGIGRAIFSNQIIEGQTFNGYNVGWSRVIYSDGEYEHGWFKNNFPLGYGKRFLMGVQEEGFFENNEVKSDAYLKSS